MLEAAATVEEREAYDVLLGLARGKTGAIPPDSLVRHVLTVTASADWPVQRAAMEAVLRRCAFGKRDRLRVAARPPNGRALGIYRTRRQSSAKRPYTTLLTRVDPLRGSCDCADFLRNSLGICKHLLAVANDVISRPRALRKAREEQEKEPAFTGGMLIWDPIRPLTGNGDWLERIRLRVMNGQPRDETGTVIGRLFPAQENGFRVLRTSQLAETGERLALVENLLQLIGTPAEAGHSALSSEPAVPALLRSERERLRTLCVDGVGALQMRAAIRSMKRKPYEYQREGVRRFLASGSLLLADDMGLGKTIQAISACHILWGSQRVRRGLLVVPASLKPQWVREWQSFTSVALTLVEGSPAERHALYRKTKHGFLLTNYELLLRDFAEIAAWKPEIVVLDEAQRIKNWATKTATYVKRLEPRYRLVLTGTPLENRLDELASIFDWVDSFALEPKWRLTPWHTAYGDGRNEVRGARNLETLRTRLAPSMVRRTRQEVLDQLPPRTDSVVPVEITAAQRNEHDELTQPIAALVRRARKRPLTQAEFLKLMSLLATQRIIANGLAQLRFADVWPGLSQSTPEAALLQSLATPKLVELREILSQLLVEQRRKVVVFSQWRRMLQLAHWAIGDILRDAGQRAVFFTGQEGQKRRTQNIVELHDDPSTSVLFATDSGGVGLNLQRAANCCINIDLPWNPAVLEQRIGRIYRLGQKRPITVYNLVTQGSIEERIAGLIGEKKALFSGLFEGTSDEVQFDRSGSFLSRIERVIEPAEVPETREEESEFEEEVAVERELEEIVTAADETADIRVPDVAQGANGGTKQKPPELRPDSIRAQASAEDVRNLFAQLQIRPQPNGGVSIEAPPEAAATLATLFEQMAKLMRAQA